MCGGGEGEYKKGRWGGGGGVNGRSSNRCITKSCPHYVSDVNVQTQQVYTSHYMVKHKGVEVKAALTMPVVEIHTCTNTTGI